MKRIGLLLILASLLFAEKAKNWNGYADQTTFASFAGTATVYSDSIYDLTGYDAIRIIIQVNDTARAGFSTDSIKLRWGYQTFTLCKDANGSADTCYSPRIVVDTMSVDSFGKASIYSTDANGIAASPSRQIDTISCTGYAIQTRTFAPEWNVYLRVWVQGLAGNITVTPLKLRATITRRLYRGTRGM